MLKKKIGYALGDVYGGAAFLIFSMLFMNYLVIVEGLPVGLATVIIFAGKLWDAVTDPIMGSISDRTKSKFGKRRIYFLIGSLPVFLSFVMMWCSFGIEGTTAKFIYYLFAYMFFGTAFTIVMIPYNALLPDLTGDYNERTAFTTVRLAFSAGSAILAAILPSMMIKHAGSPVNGPAQRPGYLMMAVVFGAIFALCWLLTFLWTKERNNTSQPEAFSLKRWLSVFKNKTFRIYLGLFVSVQLAVDLLLALFVFYVDIVILQYRNYEIIMGVLLVSQLLFMFVHSAIAKKWGKAYPLYFALPIWIITSVSFAFVNRSTPLIIVCLLSVLIAFGASAGNLSSWSMLSDICDVDELMTAKRREGIYSGLTTFFRKFSSGTALLIMGIGLQWAGFNQNKYNILKSGEATFDPQQYASDSLVSVIRWMFVLVPIVLLSVTLFFAVRYKLTQSRFNNVLVGIEKFKEKPIAPDFTPLEQSDFTLLTGSPIENLWGNTPSKEV